MTITMPARAGQHTLHLRSESEAQTMEIARTLALQLHGGEVVALEGPLGSGKTCFVRGLAAGLGLDPASVSSPTFMICQEYESKDAAARLALMHIDAYRLAGADELESIGWSEMLEARDAVIAVEWPSRIAKALPVDRIEVAFEHAGEHSRRLTIHGLSDLMSERWPPLADSSNAQSATAPCRTCGRPVESISATFPFCSDRCRLADLGRWFNEGYRTSREMQADDELNE